MKILAFILSFYIFALNVVPCVDYVVPHDDIDTEISQSFNDNHEHEGEDQCSPFCICQCCHINATYFQIVEVKLDIAFMTTQDFFYLNGSEKNFSTSLLQPPRA